MRLNDLEISALENNGSSRPMKANSPASAMRLNIIVSTGARKAASAHLEFIKSCIEAIGADWDKARSAAKPTKSPTTHDCCHDDTNELIDGTKEFTGLSLKVDHDINTAAESLFQDLFGASAALSEETIIGKTLAQVINESIQDGFAEAEKKWTERAKKDKEWAASNPFPDLPIEPTPEMSWLREIYNGGFTKVRNKVFQQLTPLVKRTIAQGVAAGKTMQQIAEELYSQHGSGYLWQWQRLIRTESHNAAFNANLAEYEDTGAKAVRWSAAINACKACQGIQAHNLGYYAINSVPQPPHPNCRCHTTPVFNLPFGVTVEGVAPPKPPSNAPKNEPPKIEPPTDLPPNPPKTGNPRLTGRHGMSKEEKKAFLEHCKRVMEEFGIEEDIDIHFAKAGGGGYISVYPDGRKVTKVTIDPKQSKNFTKEATVAHELKHVQQVNSGRLKYDKNGDTWWDGQMVLSKAERTRINNQMSGKTTRDIDKIKAAYEAYKSWPWEKEAWEITDYWLGKK